MPPILGVGFAAPTEGGPAASIDLTRGSQKRGSVTDSAKPVKKRRGPRKPVHIVELDDATDDVEITKNACCWKDHWVIQLISIQGEMHNIFSALPKQGNVF